MGDLDLAAAELLEACDYIYSDGKSMADEAANITMIMVLSCFSRFTPCNSCPWPAEQPWR